MIRFAYIGFLLPELLGEERNRSKFGGREGVHRGGRGRSNKKPEVPRRLDAVDGEIDEELSAEITPKVTSSVFLPEQSDWYGEFFSRGEMSEKENIEKLKTPSRIRVRVTHRFNNLCSLISIRIFGFLRLLILEKKRTSEKIVLILI